MRKLTRIPIVDFCRKKFLTVSLCDRNQPGERHGYPLEQQYHGR